VTLNDLEQRNDRRPHSAISAEAELLVQSSSKQIPLKTKREAAHAHRRRVSSLVPQIGSIKAIRHTKYQSDVNDSLQA